LEDTKREEINVDLHCCHVKDRKEEMLVFENVVS
jgi:hypothetical protein